MFVIVWRVKGIKWFKSTRLLIFAALKENVFLGTILTGNIEAKKMTYSNHDFF